MALDIQVLFDRPQQEIASVLNDHLARGVSVSLVAGFVTVAGLDIIARPLVASPTKLNHIVVGAGTYSAYEAFDALIGEGIPRDRLKVHLGMSRKRGTGKYERFRPMLHSKVYLLDMGMNRSAAFVGSHNLTSFALGGLNGEAGLLLEGDSNDPAFDRLRHHVGQCVAGAISYDPTMKDAYAWWASEYFDGLRIEVEDAPRDAKGGRTVVIIAELVVATPREGDIVYFEAPAALNEARSLGGDIHLYLFDRLPASPEQALAQLASARCKLACKTVGIEDGHGAVEVNADWHIDDRRNARLQRVAKPFRPQTASTMHQVRARVGPPLTDNMEYLFDSGHKAWKAILDDTQPYRASQDLLASVVDTGFADSSDFLKVQRRRRTETGDWFPVRELVPGEVVIKKELKLALQESAPGSGSFILVAARRRTVNS